MKKQILFILALTASLLSFGQSEKYNQTMQHLVAAFDSAASPDKLTTLANSFQRVADAEKNQWLPYYYASLANLTAGYIATMGQMGMADKTDPVADKAEALLSKAEALAKDNSEIFIVKKMIASLRMIGDPQNRFMTYGPLAEEALQNAKALNPSNPRVNLLAAQDKFYTPEQYGGSKSEAKRLADEAVQQFEAFKPESNLHPTWGLNQAKQLLSQMK